MDVINNIGSVISVNEFDGVGVYGLQRLGHLELATFVDGQSIYAL